MIKTLSAALLALFAGPAMAQQAWESTCSADRCTISRTLTATDTGQRAGTFVAVVDKADGTFLGAIIPLGTAIAPGIRLVQGGAEIEVAFQVCFPDGCRGFAEVDAATLDAFMGGETAEIRFFAMGQPAPLGVPVPLTGLDAALDAARSELGL